MPLKKTLQEDLAELAREERSRHGEPPSAEQLAAYRDGLLSEQQADRIRDRLAVDPESASLYLALRSVEDPKAAPGAAEDGVSEAEVDAAWRSLSARLEDATGPPEIRAREAARAVGYRRRRWLPAALGLAAALLLALGLGWWARTSKVVPADPTGFYRVPVSTGTFRGDRLEIPRDAAGIRFAIELPGPAEPVEIELLDAADRRVAGPAVADPGGSGFDLDVPIASLKEDHAYRLVVRTAGAAAGEPPLIDRPFRLSFVDPGETPGQPPPGSPADPVAGTSPCAAIDEVLEGANDLVRKSPGGAAGRYRRALDRARLESCPFQESRARNGLGVLAGKEGRLREALEHYRQGLALLDGEVPGSPEELGKLEATLEANRGSAYFRLGWYEDAGDALVRLRPLRNLYPLERAQLENILLLSARVHRLQGSPREARAALREGLAMPGTEPSVRAAFWQERARLDLGAGDLDDAGRALGRALELLEDLDMPRNEADVVADLAELRMHQGRWRECRDEATRALDLAADFADLNLEAQALYLRSVALAKLGNLEAARRSADGALALLEATRGLWQDLGLRFFSLRHKHYRHRLDLALARDDPGDAWSVFESYRARGLLETLGTHGAADSEPLRELRRQLLDAVRQLDRWDPASGRAVLARIEGRFHALRRQVRDLTAGGLDRSRLAPPAELGWRQAAELLDAGTLALVFAGGSDQIHLLVLDGSGRPPRSATYAADRRRLAAEISSLVDSLEPESGRELGARLEALAGDLSRLLLGPLEDRLDGFERLLIAADAPLESLPFEVLRRPGSGERLIETHEIVYLPSFSVLGALRERSRDCPAPPAGVLALGDPVLSSRDPRWPAAARDPRSRDQALLLGGRLGGTADEVREIAGLDRRTTELLGPAANRRRFLAEAPRHRVIHLASHGLTDPEVPDRSRIALSCVDAEGRPFQETCDLYLQDVLGLELCGQLVVLSACETAGGPAVEGEGRLGLPRAFLRAGAATVVASRWRVHDAGTARLMAAFHRRLHHGMTSAAALREAQRELLEGGEPPSTWAAFVLLGDGRAALQPFPLRRVLSNATAGERHRRPSEPEGRRKP